MKRLLLLFFVTVTCSTIILAQNSDAVKQYIAKYRALAINEEIRTGVPAAITLAQGILESQSGQSDLAVASNNHFGIKCKTEWTGGTYYHDDDTKQECFRVYPSVEDSYKDHSDFLKNRPYYVSLFDIDPTDYKTWARGLKRAGYATEYNYAPMLIRVIEDNDLEQYTLLALQDIKNGTQEDFASTNTFNSEGAVTINGATPASLKTNTQEDIEQPENVFEPGNYPPGIFTINHTKVTFALAGTSLFALASNNNISFSKLLDFNNLEKTDILTKDQLIFLERKPKKSNSRDYHIVAKAETIEAIAQIEGVQLESLFEYNKMQKGLEPAIGEKVYLRPGTPGYYPKLVKNNLR